ncbi:mucin-2 isoform X2 [Sipha flava]|uniref:Mucin-2 isoform X2 n=1 Tax=Sipha flava TaxID=143950 RepID=A0A8B8GBG5_9HEMI|nr:mucin-2 isoform X2 [Sipha flava]
MMMLCIFMVNMIMLETNVNADVVADGQMWTHKDIVSGMNGVKDGRNVISPRMDFDEWTPLGRGDPLKNDPTFDYLPPVLDKVHYWKPPPSPPASANRGHLSSTIPSPPMTVNYNRRFFLTDFSKREPTAAAYVQYVHKRPQMATGYYHYPMPKPPLPMLTPPPYQRPTSVAATTTVEPMDMTPSLDAGDSAAESKQPPAVRAPPPMSSVRPVLSHSVIKVLLENEVDRTTVTTGRPATTSSTTTTSTTTTQAPPTTDPLFSHYKQSAVVAGRPMYLIIQGHSKVKTYGLVSKSADLSAAQPAATHEHNHIGSQPDDEPSRRKRNGPSQ